MTPANTRIHRWIMQWGLLAGLGGVFTASGQTPGILGGPVVNSSNGHTYYLLEPASWTNAEAASLNLGGHLATINSLEENSWVYNTFSTFDGISRDLWIGFYLPDPAGASTDRDTRLAQFRWISGQPVDFRLLGDTNLILSGFCQITGPDHSYQGFEAHWTEQEPSALLNGSLNCLCP